MLNRVRLTVIVLGLALTAGHWVRADVKLLFAEKAEGEFVLVTTSRSFPMRVQLSRCRERFNREGLSVPSCVPFGRREGYTLEEIRTTAIQLSDAPDGRPQTEARVRAVDSLYDLLDGIERPQIRFETRTYSYHVKGGLKHFVRVIEKDLK